MPNLYEDPRVLQQREIARALLSRGLNPQPANSGVYTRSNMLADILSSAVGAYKSNRLDRQEADRMQGIQRTIAEALAGPQNEQQPDFVGPPQDPNQFLIRTLAGNEATAPIALEAQLKQRFGGSELPADIQSFREVEKMTPEQRELFFQTKRGAQIKDIAGVPSVISGREVTPLSSLEREASAAAAKEAAKTGAREAAQVRVAAGADLPRVEENANQMLSLLDRLDKSDLSLIYGPAAWVPIVPGTKQADVYSDWNQLQGKAFLEAFNTLKGGGQITEKEGEKATAAITSLSERRQSPAKAKQAIADLRAVVLAGVERARKKAGVATPSKPLSEMSDEEILRQLNAGP